MEQKQSENLFDLQLDQQSSVYLAETAKWGKFLSILGFILTGLLLIVGIFMGSFVASTMSAENLGGMGSSFFTVIYLVIALVYFFPCLYLYRFSAKAQDALRSNEQGMLTESFKNLKSCFRFMGILTIVILAFYALAFVIGIGAAITSGF